MTSSDTFYKIYSKALNVVSYSTTIKRALEIRNSLMEMYKVPFEIIIDENDLGYKTLNLKSDTQITDDEPIIATEGKKYDSNKPMTGTILRVFPFALNAVGACIKFGATKYPDPANWKKNKNALVRYNDSLIRHLTKHFTGNEMDEETGLPHLAHVAWNALAILELYLVEHPDKAKELMYPEEVKV